ncbi:MAG: mechanosensitive ion channel family protein [Parahaliea sp.]
MSSLTGLLGEFWPVLTVVILTTLYLLLSNWVARRGQYGTASILYQLLNWIIVSTSLLAVVVLLPISDETQGQILSLLGIVLTGVIALSSTTFVSNAMAGVMLHLTQPFRPGDYVRVNNEFGRVTKRSLVHTQIQTEWRDIATLPNLLLTNNPITVMHRDGTIISAEVSIGYDETYTLIEELLLKASTEAGLDESFVLVQDLLDHAVLYRVCGFLPEMKNPLSSRSNLRKKMLEQLHGNGIEIVSPAFMNQRRLETGQLIIPAKPVLHTGNGERPDAPAPEEKIFAQAEQAASLEEIRQAHEDVKQSLREQKTRLRSLQNDEREDAREHIQRLERKEGRLAELIRRHNKKNKQD